MHYRPAEYCVPSFTSCKWPWGGGEQRRSDKGSVSSDNSATLGRGTTKYRKWGGNGGGGWQKKKNAPAPAPVPVHTHTHPNPELSSAYLHPLFAGIISITCMNVPMPMYFEFNYKLTPYHIIQCHQN